MYGKLSSKLLAQAAKKVLSSRLRKLGDCFLLIYRFRGDCPENFRHARLQVEKVTLQKLVIGSRQLLLIRKSIIWRICRQAVLIEKYIVGEFLRRRFVDLVRVYSVLTISRTHSNTFLLIDMKKRKSFFIEYLQWLLLKFYNYFSVSFHHCVSTKKIQKAPVCRCSTKQVFLQIS